MATAAKRDMAPANDEPTRPAPALAKLREPFPPRQISKLPKETRSQIDARKANKSMMVWKCEVCGGAHHKDATHLDYVGHAAATDRLLDTDLEWTWEPLAVDQRGLPAFDDNGGLWIKLTVAGVTRLGYGSADGKSGGDAKKEIIGDAIRNAGMRFGMALDLWHKGDLHADEDANDYPPAHSGPAPRTKLEGPFGSKTALKKAIHELHGKVAVASSAEEIDKILKGAIPTIRQAEHDWPELLSGDPAIPEDTGLKGAVALRREQLTAPAEEGMYAMLIDSMKQCDTRSMLTGWMTANEPVIDALDDADRRRFEAEYDKHEAGIGAMDRVTAGA